MPRALRTCCELLRRWRRGGFSPWPGPRRKPLGGALAGAGTGGEGGAGGAGGVRGGAGTPPRFVTAAVPASTLAEHLSSKFSLLLLLLLLPFCLSPW